MRLTSEQLRECVDRAASSGWNASFAAPPILTYLTDVPDLWRLGLSASRHGFPLVLSGEGAPYGLGLGGPAAKLDAAMRAVQAHATAALPLAAATPRTPARAVLISLLRVPRQDMLIQAQRCWEAFCVLMHTHLRNLRI